MLMHVSRMRRVGINHTRMIMIMYDLFSLDICANNLLVQQQSTCNLVMMVDGEGQEIGGVHASGQRRVRVKKVGYGLIAACDSVNRTQPVKSEPLI